MVTIIDVMVIIIMQQRACFLEFRSSAVAPQSTARPVGTVLASLALTES